MSIRSIKGTHDILPGEVELWQQIESTIRLVFGLYGFSEIRTPILEWTELFSRGVGEATDIVQKEMYSLKDSKGRSITLRPEGTASIVRAHIEHSLGRSASVNRLYYIGPMFRHERPQKGRYRQFHQLGVEMLGSKNPALEAELIEAAIRFLEKLEVNEFELLVNSVGDANCRPIYIEKLSSAMIPILNHFCDGCNKRHKTNPMRVFDCKNSDCKSLLSQLPKLSDHLCHNCQEHHKELLDWLDLYNLSYREDPSLVRGLDYYARTTFEVVSKELGPTQNAILGGGRYDDLSIMLGGKALPACGFGLGLERLVMLLTSKKNIDIDVSFPIPVLFLVHLNSKALRKCVHIATQLRNQGHYVSIDFEDRSLRSQMRIANRLQSLFSCVIGDEELTTGKLTVKRMHDGKKFNTNEKDLIHTLKKEIRAIL